MYKVPFNSWLCIVQFIKKNENDAVEFDLVLQKAHLTYFSIRCLFYSFSINDHNTSTKSVLILCKNFITGKAWLSFLVRLMKPSKLMSPQNKPQRINLFFPSPILFVHVMYFMKFFLASSFVVYTIIKLPWLSWNWVHGSISHFHHQYCLCHN